MQFGLLGRRVGRLVVQGDGVVHGGGDAGLLELVLKGFAVGHLDGVLGPGAGVVRFDVGGDKDGLCLRL